MKIMFIGLGLMGGSMALSLSGKPGIELYAVDQDPWTRFEALNRDAVCAAWPAVQDAPLSEMDVVFLCLHPEAAAEFIRTEHKRIRPGALLTDVCGVKGLIREAVNSLGALPFVYLGGHPMAGRERGGFVNASANLLVGAHYILTPDENTPEESIAVMRDLVLSMGCVDVVISNPEMHDERIAYTSQLMHLLALALCDDPLLFDSYGFEGGSFRGATRVAALEPDLWCELFWTNRETLAKLTDRLCDHLGEYSALLRGGDRAALLDRLTASSNRKKEFDKLRSPEPTQTPLFKD